MKTVALKLILILSLVITTGASGQEKKLPSDSLDILMSLRDFEDKEREKYERVIRDKREIVIKILEKHMERETKSGELDAALEIRKTIQMLQAEQAASEIPAEDLSTLVGSRWVWVEGNEKSRGTGIEFKSDGEVLIHVPGDSPWKWTYWTEDPKIFIKAPDQPAAIFTMNAEKTRISFIQWGVFERDGKKGG